MLLNGTLILSAYYTSWSIYGRNFQVPQLPFKNLTHVNYAFAGVESSGNVYLTDLWADIQRPDTQRHVGADGLSGNLGALYEYKQENPNLKVGLSIGGWQGSAGFSTAASSNQTRSTFAKSALSLILNLGLDYIDLDWEYPVSGGPDGQLHAAEDGRNYVLLLQEIRIEFSRAIKDGRWRGTQPPGISLALPCGQFIGRYDYLKEMGQIVDFANMMCYDFSGPTSKLGDHHSNLFSRHVGNYSADAGIKELLAAGFPARKTILGIPIYGRGFENCHGLASQFKGAPVGTWGELGVFDYKALNLRQNATVCRPLIELKTNGTYCHNNQLNRLLVYDSVTAVQRKVEYVKKNGLAGVMFWEASADIYTDPRDGLIAAAKAAISPYTLDHISNNLCYPNSTYSNINSLQNCTNKSGPGGNEFIPIKLKPVDIENVRRAVPFGSRIHRNFV